MKNRIRYFLYFLLLLLLNGLFTPETFAQTADNPVVKVVGEVYSENDSEDVSNLLVVNKRTGQGEFGDPSGHFSIHIHKNDTLLIGSIGHSTTVICFRDSILKEVYHVKAKLIPLEHELEAVPVFGERDVQDIHEEMKELGYDKKEHMLNGMDAAFSPITYLYQAFSRREQSKRKVAQLINDEKRRALLKELFRKYVDADIIHLNDSEFDAFIDYCNVSDHFMKNTSEYDFILYIKKRFRSYYQERKDYWDERR